MQSSRRAGSNHRPSRRCRIQGNLKTQGRRSRRVRGPRKLGNPSADAKGVRDRGNPEAQHPRRNRKTKRVRKLKASSGGATGRSGARGRPRAQAPGAPKNERFGVTRISVAGRAGRCRDRGIPGTCIERRSWKSEAARQLAADATEVPKDTRVGATR
jgi:hypothetical protein